MGHQHVVDYGFGRTEFGDLEVVDEEFVVLVIEGEVEIHQFVHVQVLQARVVRDDDV
jgi:hypothetical protein